MEAELLEDMADEEDDILTLLLIFWCEVEEE